MERSSSRSIPPCGGSRGPSGRPGADADDLLQEALARTLSVRSLGSIEDPLNYLRTAMVRVASNLARGARRSDARLRNEVARR